MAAIAGQPALEPHQAQALLSPSDIHILLVDDERLTRLVVGNLLRACKYKVTIADSGSEALDVLRKAGPGEFQLILTDVIMPEVDGLDLLRFVRSHQHLASVPVVMMSASERQETMCACLLGGAEEYLVKPVTRKEVQNIWTHVMKRLSAQPSSTAAPFGMVPEGDASAAAAAAAAAWGASLLAGAAGMGGFPGGAAQLEAIAAASLQGQGLGMGPQLTEDAHARLALMAGLAGLPPPAAGQPDVAGSLMPSAAPPGAQGAGAGKGPWMPGGFALMPFHHQFQQHQQQMEPTAGGRRQQHHHHSLALVPAAGPGPQSLLQRARKAERVNLLKWLCRPHRVVQPKESFWIFCEVLLSLEHSHGAAPPAGGAASGPLLRPSRMYLHSNGRIVFTDQHPPAHQPPQHRQQQQQEHAPLAHQAMGAAPTLHGSRSPSPSPPIHAHMHVATAAMEAAHMTQQLARAGGAGAPTPSPTGMPPPPQHAAGGAAPWSLTSGLTGAELAEEEALYGSPEEAEGAPPTLASAMFSLGVLFFELFHSCSASAAADACGLRHSTLQQLRQRILPPAFLRAQPKEAAFTLALLHPDPALRPSVPELLASEMFRATCATLRQRHASLAAAEAQLDSVVLSDFLRTMKQRKLAEVAAVGQQLDALEADAQVVEQYLQYMHQARAAKRMRAAGAGGGSPPGGVMAGALQGRSSSRAAGPTPLVAMPVEVDAGGAYGQGQQVAGAAAAATAVSVEAAGGAACSTGLHHPLAPCRCGSPGHSAAGDEGSIVGSGHEGGRPGPRDLGPEPMEVEAEQQQQPDAAAIGPYTPYAPGAEGQHAGPAQGPLAGHGPPGSAPAAISPTTTATSSSSWLEARRVAEAKWRHAEAAAPQLEAVFFERRRLEEGAAKSPPAAAAAVAAAAPQPIAAARRAFAGRSGDAGGLPEYLLGFAEDLSCYCRYRQLSVVASLRYGDAPSTANMVCSTAFDRDDEFFATAGVSKRIKIFEYQGVVANSHVGLHYPVLEISSRSRLSSVCWSGYIKGHLASADYEGLVQLWDANTHSELMQFEEHSKRVWSIDFSPVDPARLISGSDDGTVRLWSINQEASATTIDLKANVCSVAFSPHSPHLMAAGCANYRVYCYDLRAPATPLAVAAGHSKAVSYVRYVSRHELATASTDNTLKLWDLGAHVGGPSVSDTCDVPRCVQTFTGHANERNFVGLAATPEGYLACGSENNRVFCYYRNLPMPMTSFSFSGSEPGGSGGTEGAGGGGGGAPLGAAAGGGMAGAGSSDAGQFVSSVCWSRRGNVLLAANSHGTIKLLALQ